MRVVLAAGIFPPDIGGPATYARHLADSLVQRGHEVLVVCYSSSATSSEKFLYPVWRISRSMPKILTVLSYTLRLFSASRSADVVYAQGPVAGGMQARVVSAILRKPYVVKITGDYAWEQGVSRYGMGISIDDFQKNTKDVPAPVRFLRYVQRAVTVNAAKVVVPSRYLRKVVSEWGVADQSVSVVYNAAVHPHENGPVGAAQRSSHPLVLSAGRLVPWKGFGTLIRAWPEVLHRYPSARLVIAGSGPDRDTLESLIRERGLHESVSLVGVQTPAEMAGWYMEADVFVLNSGYEGFSHTLLEAQSYGLPCVASDSGGNPEIVVDGRTGVLFPYDNQQKLVKSLLGLLDNPGDMRRYAQEAKIPLRAMTVDRMVQDTIAILSDAAERRRS